MIKNSNYFMWILAVLGGFALRMSYINPYTGSLSLTELILQLSGSRGELPLGFSLNELLQFTMKLFPAWLFEAFMGIELYRHFCTASIYVFSRCEKRGRWYWKKMLSLLISVMEFQLILIISSIVITWFRYEIAVDVNGWKMMLAYFVIYTIWTYTITIVMNVLAIKFGSSSGFMTAIIMQVIGIAALAFGRKGDFFLEINIMSRLVLGWQFRQGISILLLGTVCVAVLLTGMVIVCKHDLLIADSEIGGM